MKSPRKLVPKPAPRAADSAMAQAVLDGLTASPKRLPPWLFYDAAGSRLFDAITKQPEYYVTRTERAIFAQYASEILDAAGERLAAVELGAGSAEKTRLLLAQLLRRQPRAAYYPIDVSESAVQAAAKSLRREFPSLAVTPIVADYAAGVEKVLMIDGRKLVMFIGSSIGNYEPDEALALLQRVRRVMRPGDTFLLGTDMVKPEKILQAAYNDAAGVTARFNLNVLTRINRELAGDFKLNAFRHVALWNRNKSRVEMHLESLRAQRVAIGALRMEVDLEEGERIHTENSYKYLPKQVASLLGRAGFEPRQNWYDPRRWFGVHLASVERGATAAHASSRLEG